MIKGITKSGFSYELDENKLDDMELLDAIAEVDSNPLNISKVLKTILGEDQRKALYDHLRDDTGRVSVKTVTEAIADIFSSSGSDGKNS